MFDRPLVERHRRIQFEQITFRPCLISVYTASQLGRAYGNIACRSVVRGLSRLFCVAPSPRVEGRNHVLLEKVMRVMTRASVQCFRCH